MPGKAGDGRADSRGVYPTLAQMLYLTPILQGALFPQNPRITAPDS